MKVLRSVLFLRRNSICAIFVCRMQPNVSGNFIKNRTIFLLVSTVRHRVIVTEICARNRNSTAQQNSIAIIVEHRLYMRCNYGCCWWNGKTNRALTHTHTHANKLLYSSRNIALLRVHHFFARCVCNTAYVQCHNISNNKNNRGAIQEVAVASAATSTSFSSTLFLFACLFFKLFFCFQLLCPSGFYLMF